MKPEFIEQGFGIAPSPCQRIFGAGEMADLTRNFDWSRTPLGPVESWPETLITTVNLLLASRHPMFLWWGPELIQFYNDGYRPTIRDDKHPKALGQRGVECWPEIWPIIGPQIEGVMQRGEATWHRNALVPICRNGVLEDVYWTYGYSPVRDAGGAIRGTLVVCSETTEEILGAKRLHKSEARFRQLIEHANVGVVIGSLEGHLSYLNPTMLNILGYSMDDVYSGQVSWKNITPPEFFESDANAIRQLRERGYCDPYQKEYIAKNGHRIPLLVGASMISGALGSNDEVAVFLTDLSLSKQTENVLRQTEKLAVVGRLASSIAHEINNPLEAVTNLLYLIEHAPDNSDIKRYAEMAQQELNRVSQIATQTLRFHRQSTNPTLTKLSHIVDGVLQMFAGRISNSGIKVDKRYRDSVSVLCYEADLRQVFANLLGNAVDACQTGCRIFLRVRDSIDHKTGHPGVRVTVADTGHGMAEEIRAHIFEPFFTTKGETGTGLGLWVSSEILQKHLAGVHVRSRRDAACHGTVFSIFFPMNPRSGIPSRPSVE